MFLPVSIYFLIFSDPWFANLLEVDAETRARSAIQTTNGGYLVAGDIVDSQITNPDLLLVKLAADGSLEWARIYGARNGGLSSVIQTKDGGYALAGFTWYPLNVKSEFLVVKLAPDGSVQWARSYGGQLHDEARSIIQTKDGGYLLAGNTRSFGAGENDIMVIKTDSKGTVSWARTYRGAKDDRVYSAIQAEDGGYVLAGGTTSSGSGGEDVLLVKIFASGSLKWANAYGKEGYDDALSLIQTASKDYCLAGWTESFGNGDERDFLFLRIRDDGSIRWAKRIGAENWEEAYSIIQTGDKGFAIAGFTETPKGGQNDFLVVKFNESGDLMWTKTYRNSAETAMATSVIQARDGSLVVAGTTSMETITNFLVLKMSPDGSGPKCLGNYSPGVTNIDFVASPSSISVKDCSVFTDPQDPKVRTPYFMKPRNLCE